MYIHIVSLIACDWQPAAPLWLRQSSQAIDGAAHSHV